GALPTGVTFTNSGNGTATLSGTPAIGTAGKFGLTFTASNGVSPDATQNFTLIVKHEPVLVTGADAGGGPQVSLFDAVTHTLLRSFFAYDQNFTGGVRVASGDINGD